MIFKNKGFRVQIAEPLFKFQYFYTFLRAMDGRPCKSANSFAYSASRPSDFIVFGVCGSFAFCFELLDYDYAVCPSLPLLY